MVGKVVDVFVVFKGYSEGCSVVGFFFDVFCGLGIAGEVVFVVIDIGFCSELVWFVVYSVSYWEYYRFYFYIKIY